LFKKHYFVGTKILEKLEVSGEQRQQLVAALERLVRETDTRTVELCKALLRLDPTSRCVRERVERDLRSGDWEMEAACDVLCALSEIGQPSAEFVPLLIEQLGAHRDYWDFCWAAVDALNRIGPVAVEALPILREMLAHPSPLVQRRAERAIASIEGHPIPEEDQDGETSENED
jgi:HEAT repeat protein